MAIEIHEEGCCLEDEGEDAGDGVRCIGETAFARAQIVLDCCIRVKRLTHSIINNISIILDVLHKARIFRMYKMIVSLKVVDVLVVFFELFELEAVRVVFIDDFEGQPCLLICDFLAHLLHHGLELDEVEAALALLAEVVEHLLQAQLVPLYHFVQLYKDLCHALPRRTRSPHLLLHRLLQPVYLEHFDDFLDRDGAAVVDVGGFEDVDCLLLGDFWVDCAEEVEVAVEGEVFLLVLEAVLAEELFETVLVEVEVLPQLSHDALHRLLVLLALRQPREEAVEDGVREHFPPAEPLALVHLQRLFDEVDCLGR